MSCPLAIATIVTYCAGTDRSCEVQRPTGLHLFKVSDNVLHFDVNEGDSYELVLPVNKKDRGLWSWEGLTPTKKSPENKDKIDPLLVTGFRTLGVFEPLPNVTRATLRRLAGNDRIGICRVNPPDSVTFTAWLALPFSRSVMQVWNQPLSDTPEIPIAWLACAIASIALCWARDTRVNHTTVPADVVYSILNGSLLADAILWIALGVVMSEDAGESALFGSVNHIVIYAGLFLLAEAIIQAHYAFEKSGWLHGLLGILALFTSAFYLSTLLLWIWAILVWGQNGTQKVAKGKKDDGDIAKTIQSLVF